MAGIAFSGLLKRAGTGGRAEFFHCAPVPPIVALLYSRPYRYRIDRR